MAENFLVKRAGATTGVLALERGSTIKVRVPDARPVVCIRFSISEGVSSAEIEEFATLLVDTEVRVNSKHMRRGWGLIRVPRRRLDTIMAGEAVKHFLSEDERIELEINTKKPEGGDYVLGEGDAVDLAPHVSKRLSSSQLALDSPPPRQGQGPQRAPPSQAGTAKRKIESSQSWQARKWGRSDSSAAGRRPKGEQAKEIRGVARVQITRRSTTTGVEGPATPLFP